VRLPGGGGTGRIDAPVGLVDVVPTIFDSLGIEPPGDLSGRSLLPLLRGADEPAPRVTVAGFMDGWRTVVTGRYKLVQRTADRARLYDLAEDPDQQHDVAPERPIALGHARVRLGLALAASSGGARTTPTRRRRRHRPADTEVDPETEAQLRALGYVR